MCGHVVPPDEIQARLRQLDIKIADETTACGKIGTDLNLNAAAIGLGLDDIFYEPDNFPGLVYTPDGRSNTVVVFFADGVAFITASESAAIDAVFRDAGDSISELGLLDRDISTVELEYDPDSVPVPDGYTGSGGWDGRSLFDASGDDLVISGDDHRQPDRTFAGEGDGFTESFEVPGGVVFINLTVDGESYCDVTAVGQSTEDVSIKYVKDGGPVTHRRAEQMDRGTYIIDIETEDNSLSWEVDLFFEPPEPISLPYQTATQGDRVIGPIAHSGFIRVDLINGGDEELVVQQFESDLKTSNGATYVSPASGGQPTTATEICSTVDDSMEWPWLVVESFGSDGWEIEVVAHD